MAVGRPSKYKPEYCRAIVDSAKSGSSIAAFAAEVGVSRHRLNEWAKKHRQFRDAMEISQSIAQRFWESRLHKAALGIIEKIDGIPLKNPNASLIMFIMKNRFRDDYGDQIRVDQGDLEYETPASLS